MHKNIIALAIKGSEQTTSTLTIYSNVVDLCEVEQIEGNILSDALFFFHQIILFFIKVGNRECTEKICVDRITSYY